MTNRYAYQKFDEKKMVAVIGMNLAIASKHSVEVARFLKGKQVDKAITLLEAVSEQKIAVPFKRYNADLPHRRGGMGPGRYPVNVALAVIKLLNNLKGAAKQKGLDESKLMLVHVAANYGSKRRKQGRHRGIKKNTNFELVAGIVESKPKQEKK
nr:50S ribosomal protein L22P, large subunit ribosomal protein L22 [uncultured archaeon]